MSIKTVRTMLVTIAAAITVCLVLMLLTLIDIFGYLTIALTAVYFIFLFAFWRCPNCHKFLGRMQKYQTCKHCKKTLEL